jgi:AhpD family alkylhydroperoxidase
MKSEKRFYTAKSFRKAFVDIAVNFSALKIAARSNEVDNAFSERIMLAVTQVNDCDRCVYTHTNMALNAGVSVKEIKELLAGQFDDQPEHEIVALVFAQHFAATEGKYDASAWLKVVEHYGEEAAADILTIIRIITLGNLSGNTISNLQKRFKGEPTNNSRLLDELFVSAATIVLGIFLKWLWMFWGRSSNREHISNAKTRRCSDRSHD